MPYGIEDFSHRNRQILQGMVRSHVWIPENATEAWQTSEVTEYGNQNVAGRTFLYAESTFAISLHQKQEISRWTLDDNTLLHRHVATFEASQAFARHFSQKDSKRTGNVSDERVASRQTDSETEEGASETNCAPSFTNWTRTNSNSFCACAVHSRWQTIHFPSCLDFACIVQRGWQMSSLFMQRHHVLLPPLVSEPTYQGTAFHLKSTFSASQSWRRKLAHRGRLPRQKTQMRKYLARTELVQLNWDRNHFAASKILVWVSTWLEGHFFSGVRNASSISACATNTRHAEEQCWKIDNKSRRISGNSKYDLDVQDTRKYGWKQPSNSLARQVLYESLRRKTGRKLLVTRHQNKKNLPGHNVLLPPLVSEPTYQGTAFHLKSTFSASQSWRRKLAHRGRLPRQKTQMPKYLARTELVQLNWDRNHFAASKILVWVSTWLEGHFFSGVRNASSISACATNKRHAEEQCWKIDNKSWRISGNSKYDLDVQDTRKYGWKQPSNSLARQVLYESLRRKTGRKLLVTRHQNKKNCQDIMSCSRLWFRSQHTRALLSIWNRHFLQASLGGGNWLTAVACHDKKTQMPKYLARTELVQLNWDRNHFAASKILVWVSTWLEGHFFSGVRNASSISACATNTRHAEEQCWKIDNKSRRISGNSKYDLDVQDTRKYGWKQPSNSLARQVLYESLRRKTARKLLVTRHQNKKNCQDIMSCSRLWFRSQHTRALLSIWNRLFLQASLGGGNWLTAVACHDKRLKCQSIWQEQS